MKIRVFLTFLLFLILLNHDTALAQRIVLPSSTTNANSSTLSTSNNLLQTRILKTYPDGTKKIVPLDALNFHDDGKAFGGPPQLSIFSDSPISAKKFDPERLSVAPIGTADMPTSIQAPSRSLDPSVSSISNTSAGDPMGGGISSSPMGGASAPIDPLGSSSPKGAAPPLQTVSGKPAPVSSAETSIELGTFEDFFMNAAIGGSMQGQLTARRVYNGTNMQAYPTPPDLPKASFPYNGAVDENDNPVGVSGENFTFQPGFRFDVEFGYNIYDWLGVSLQTGIIYNAISQYNITFSDGSSYHNSANGELVQVPIQLDGILRWPGNLAFKPFIGGGIGAVWQQLDVNNYYFGPQDIQGNYCRSAFQFGFNAQLGANYTVTPGVDFYGVFKLLGAFTPRIGNYDFENSYNFALEVGIQSRF